VLRPCLTFAIAISLAGCVTNGVPPQHQNKKFHRADGKVLRDHPVLQKQSELDFAVCKGEANKAALTAQPIHVQGLVGVIAADQINAQRRSAVFDVLIGCMASKGYAFSIRD
jgi:hypothetical protein